MSTTLLILIRIFILIIGFIIGYYLRNIYSALGEDRTETIKHVLLYLVAMAEKQLGSGTGKLKLAQVYNEFMIQFPALAALVTYEQFSSLVDEVLEQFNHMLDTNDAIAKVINE